MSRHMVDGISYMASGSVRLAPTTPIKEMYGEHSAVWVFDIQTGCLGPANLAMVAQDHTDITGARVILVTHWKDKFLQAGGTGVARLYVDRNRTNPAQEAALTRAFQGGLGGPPGLFRGLNFLESRPITILMRTDCSDDAHQPDVIHIVADSSGQVKSDGGAASSGGADLVDGSGHLVLRRQRNATGKPVPWPSKEQPLDQQCTLTDGTGSRWRDSGVLPGENGYWESSGYAQVCFFDWGWPEAGEEPKAPSVTPLHTAGVTPNPTDAATPPGSTPPGSPHSSPYET